MIKHFILISFSFLLLTSCQQKSGPVSLEINSDWTFKSLQDTIWMPAEVPGSVHTDLIRNGVIQDPYFRLNELDCQWVDKIDWEYKTKFKIDPALLKYHNIELDFHGLDTHADVYLNGKEILKTDNMFIRWQIDCKNHLIADSNELRIVFRSATQFGLTEREALGYYLPGAENDQSQRGELGDIKTCVFSRKAQYHFGWDWGPRLVSSGIFQTVELHAWNSARIIDIHHDINELTIEKAKINLDIELEMVEYGNYEFELLIDNEAYASFDKSLKIGKNKITLPIEISDPEWWFPNGMGQQKLYKLSIQLKKEGQIIGQKEKKIGLRTIEVVQDADTTGHSFYFKVNGFPVFMKGANYIPQDIFLNRVSDEKYTQLILDAKEANFNMLRVWGGGVYEKDIFYDLCDEHGILVWQDFMFACAMYPGNPEFIDNVRLEAEQNVKRLRDHASLALWCGDNEVLSAWNRWGWKETVLKEQGESVVDTVWQAYDTLFHHVLPAVVQSLDPKKLYWTSSPSAGFGQLEDWKSGDVHYWGVWWGKEAFSNYKTKIGRFMSEYGFQSFPDFNSVRKYTINEDHDIYSEVMQSHQRSSIGNVTIDEYLKRDYKEPKDFPMFLYVNQVLQAEGIKMAIEAHRRNMPFCMGSLYWQINDCWPVASWSGIDYYGNWKALHYFAKKAFEPVLVSPDVTSDDTLKISLVSDLLEQKNGILSVKLVDMMGKVLWGKNENVSISANASSLVFEMAVSDIIGAAQREDIFFRVELLDENDQFLSGNNLFLVPVKSLNLSRPTFTKEVLKTKNGFEIIIHSDNLAKNIYLFADGLEGRFSDNYFDLLPGQSVKIKFKTSEAIELEIFINKLNLYSLIDSYEN